MANDKARQAGIDVLLSCGEASGELYAAELLRELRIIEPQTHCYGLGSRRLKEAGAEILVDLEDISVIGLVEVLSKLPALKRAQTALLAAASERKPDVAVLIDFSGFNLRLASRLKALGVPVVYYVSPQVWAWRRGRLKAIRDHVDRMLVILPFEESFYRNAGVAAKFVGHPLVDLVRSRENRPSFFRRAGLEEHRPLVVLMPGSRARELELHLPVIAGAMEKMKVRQPELQFALVKAPTVEERAVEAGLGRTFASVRVLGESGYDALAHAQAAIVASGTATVEAALSETPMVVIYRVGALSYRLGKPLVRVPFYAMVNLIAERTVVPELIQDEMTEERLAAETLRLLEDRQAAESMRRDLREVKNRLGRGGASRNVAQEVLDLARSRRDATRPRHEVMTT